VTPALPIVNITQGTSYSIIQEALDAAQSGDTIRVNDGFYSGSLIFPSGEVIILESVNGPAFTQIEGLSGSPAITCNGSPAGTEIIGFHISHAAGEKGCGLYHTNGSISISGCNIDHHSSTGSGGGILNDQATLTVSSCNITLNSADVSGGGIMNDQGTLTIEGATIISQNTSDYGGGLCNYHATLTVNEGCIISENTAYSDGGGIINDQGTLTLSGNSTISQNLTTFNGGGIYNDYGTFTVTNGSTISENVSNNGNGGGIFNNYGTLGVLASTVSKNTGAFGGGITNNWGNLTVAESTISENFASIDGGGIDNYNGNLTVTGSTISKNSAAYYGGGICLSIHPVTLPLTIVIGGSGIIDYVDFNSFINNKQENTISSAAHIQSLDTGNPHDVHGDFPYNYYSP
jgi:hypothetical protein